MQYSSAMPFEQATTCSVATSLWSCIAEQQLGHVAQVESLQRKFSMIHSTLAQQEASTGCRDPRPPEPLHLSALHPTRGPSSPPITPPNAQVTPHAPAAY